jgi:hypothetical protein
MHAVKHNVPVHVTAINRDIKFDNIIYNNNC